VDSEIEDLGGTLGDALLATHRSYLKAIQTLKKKNLLLAAAHITGGGITDNLPRVLPEGLGAAIEKTSWTVPPLFEMLRMLGHVPDADWRRTFNLGVGMILTVSQKNAVTAIRALKRAGEKPWVIGEVIQQRKGKGRVEYR
jgi:phosphoribosylformylglycinamidine cyclo-ligase